MVTREPKPEGKKSYLKPVPYPRLPNYRLLNSNLNSITRGQCCYVRPNPFSSPALGNRSRGDDRKGQQPQSRLSPFGLCRTVSKLLLGRSRSYLQRCASCYNYKTTVPISLKIRLLDKVKATLDLCRRLCAAGAARIAVHALCRASWEQQGP